MECQNIATRIRREVLIRTAKALFAENMEDVIDRIPIEMMPKTAENLRCCIYKDRAVVKYRTMAALGVDVQDEEDELKTLASYATEARQREKPEGPALTVLDIACSGCTKAQYRITDTCRGCLARPCMVNCPRNCIRMENGRAKIDTENCINCGKCRDVCPYNAVTRMPVPCEEACPVDAITKDENGKERIDFEKCIHCGRCMRACPFGAVMERSQIVDVIRRLKGADKMVAMVAPAISGQFPGQISQIAGALKKLGFDTVIEVAAGADITAAHETAEFLERMEEGKKLLTTSCCPAYIESVRKHIPELAPFVSDTRTPMHYTAKMMKEKYPGIVTVFIGPCVAKRVEAMRDEYTDYVLTFEELGALFVAADIEVAVCDDAETEQGASREGRNFAVTGGVADAVKTAAGEDVEIKPLIISGLNRQAIGKLRLCAAGKFDANLVEVMACEGGCVAGAGVLGAVKYATKAVHDHADKSLPIPHVDPHKHG